MRGRPIKFFKLEFKSEEEKQAFDKKYQVGFENDSILLMKNRYFQDAFYKVGAEDYFDNQEYIFKYFKKVSKLN